MESIVSTITKSIQNSRIISNSLYEIDSGFSAAQEDILTNMVTMCRPIDLSSHQSRNSHRIIKNYWFTNENHCKNPDLIRSIVAWQYVYANDPAEARYYATYKDADNESLNGCQIYYLDLNQDVLNKNLLHNGFWSITVYNTDGYLTKTLWNKYSVNNRSVNKGPIYFVPSSKLRSSWSEGDLQYVQTLPANVIPIPDEGYFYVIFRLYLGKYPVTLPNITKLSI